MVRAVSLSTMRLSPHSLTPGIETYGIWGLVEFGNRMAPSTSRALPPQVNYPRLHLNAFRGEPAISGFVWHFTPTHSSSYSFASLTGSSLHFDFIEGSLWPWVAHPASGLIRATKSPCSDSLSLRLRNLYCLTSYTD